MTPLACSSTTHRHHMMQNFNLFTKLGELTLAATDWFNDSYKLIKARRSLSPPQAIKMSPCVSTTIRVTTNLHCASPSVVHCGCVRASVLCDAIPHERWRTHARTHTTAVKTHTATRTRSLQLGFHHSSVLLPWRSLPLQEFDSNFSRAGSAQISHRPWLHYLLPPVFVC